MALDSSYVITALTGKQGIQGLRGETGDKGANGADGKSVIAQYSVDGSSNWHSTYTSGDIYMRTSTDSGTTWSSAVRIVGEKGDKGDTGAKGEKGDKGATGDSGTRGLQTFSGTEIASYFTPEITQKLTTASNGITSTSMAIYKGDLYQNTITGDVWVCTTAGTASTAKWTWEQRIINDNDNENVFRFFTPQTPYNNQSSQFNVEEVEGETPFGNIGKLFHIARNGTASTKYSNARPYLYKTFSIDNSKAYRYVCYFKCTATQGYSNYFGLKGYNTTNLPILDMSGATVDSAYFCNFSASRDYWQCIIGYIYPNGTTQATYQDAGIWNCSNGSKIADCTNYQWASGLTSMYHYGTLIFYTGTEGKTDKADAYIYDMRFEPVNDNMPTLNELLTGSNAGITLECNISSLDFILRKDKSTNYQSQSFTVALRQGGAILTPSSVTISTSNSTGVTVTKSGTSTITVTVSTSSGGKTLPSGAIKITLPFGGVNYSIDIPISSSSSGKYLGLKSALPTSTTDCVLGNYFVASATFTSNNKTYTASYVYEYVCTAANTYTWQITTEINTVETFGDILSLASASNNTQAVAIVQRLVASDIFVNNLSAQKILFQHFVASISSENPALGDMMIYMGKNPKNNTAASEYQFSISKYIGKFGEQEMWKNMLATKILASGLLSLMITGCVEVSDEVKIANNSSIVDTGFYETQQKNADGSYIKTMGVFNNQYYLISTSGSFFLSKNLNSDFTYNDTLKNVAQNLVHNCIVDGKMYCLMQKKLLSSSDLLNWKSHLETNETIKKGSYWKSKNKYVIQATDNTDSILYIFDFDLKTYNTLKTSSIYSFLISDDYVFFYDSKDDIFYITDGNTLTPIDLSIKHDTSTGYKPFELLASYNNKFYITALSENQPSTGFNYDFYEISYNGELKTTLLFSKKTFFFRFDYSNTFKTLTPYGIVLSYFKFLYLLDWNGNITDISPDSTKENTLTYFYYTEGFAYFIKAYSGIVFVSENLKEWKTLTIPLNSAHKNPYVYGVFFINNLQLFLSIGNTTASSPEELNPTVDLFKMEKVSVGESLKSLQERPYIQSCNLAETGYVKWSNGFLIQWGKSMLEYDNSGNYKYSTITTPLSYKDKNSFSAFVQSSPAGSAGNHCCAWDFNRTANSFGVLRSYSNSETRWLTVGT